jgi:glutaredoxin-related protein
MIELFLLIVPPVSVHFYFRNISKKYDEAKTTEFHCEMREFLKYRNSHVRFGLAVNRKLPIEFLEVLTADKNKEVKDIATMNYNHRVWMANEYSAFYDVVKDQELLDNFLDISPMILDDYLYLYNKRASRLTVH